MLLRHTNYPKIQNYPQNYPKHFLMKRDAKQNPNMRKQMKANDINEKETSKKQARNRTQILLM
jgi:hypothetical protein